MGEKVTLDKLNQKSHTLNLYDRAEMNIGGVNDVSEFSDEAVHLKTTMGAMTIKGNNLSISKLDIENGNVSISGSVDLIQYHSKEKGGFFAGLLK
ncbi:MAG: sporulation protein YabP [Clostridia bacterium]|nr:sporulation protein YabP [Clostridia bacterium]